MLNELKTLFCCLPCAALEAAVAGGLFPLQELFLSFGGLQKYCPTITR